MQMTYKAGIVMAALVSAATLAPASAQTPTPPAATPPAVADGVRTATDDDARQTAQLMQFAANNAAFDAVVEQTAQTFFRRQISECAAPEKAVRQLPTRYGRVSFPPTTPDQRFPYPEYGVWAEHVKIRGCDKIWTINMLAVARGKTEPMLLAMIPGETRIDPASMRDAEKMAATSVRKAASTPCAGDPSLAYAHFLGYKQPDGKLGPADAQQGWFEEWRFTYCQDTVTAQMAFLPDGKGGVDIKTRVIPATMPKVPVQKPQQGASPAPAPASETAPETAPEAAPASVPAPATKSAQ